jgi:hypothetical protein
MDTLGGTHDQDDDDDCWRFGTHRDERRFDAPSDRIRPMLRQLRSDLLENEWRLGGVRDFLSGNYVRHCAHETFERRQSDPIGISPSLRPMKFCSVNFFAKAVASAALCVAAPSLAQSPQDLGTTTRGRVRDTSSVLETQRLIDRMGLPCRVSDATPRGRDEDGGRHYEVACDDAPGWLLVDRADPIAIDCLALESQNARARSGRGGRLVPTCRLSGNRNSTRHYTIMARQAGMTCRVDSGLSMGRSPEGAPVYEIGCRDDVGAWIERRSDGFVLTDCLQVRALGARCELTTSAEEAGSLANWLSYAQVESCRPTGVRAMGRNRQGVSWYELQCSASEPVVVARDDRGSTLEVISCSDAAVRLEPCEW